MLTVFELLTLEGWNNIFEQARGVSDWAIPYFISFILIVTFVILNIVIAVVINSVEEARRIELEREAGRALVGQASEAPQLAERVADLREALDEFERQLARTGASDGRRRPSGARDLAGEET